jgi:hypothetical protein
MLVVGTVLLCWTKKSKEAALGGQSMHPDCVASLGACGMAVKIKQSSLRVRGGLK